MLFKVKARENFQRFRWGFWSRNHFLFFEHFYLNQVDLLKVEGTFWDHVTFYSVKITLLSIRGTFTDQYFDDRSGTFSLLSWALFQDWGNDFLHFRVNHSLNKNLKKHSPLPTPTPNSQLLKYLLCNLPVIYIYIPNIKKVTELFKKWGCVYILIVIEFVREF